MQDSTDSFSWLFEALKRNYQSKTNWVQIAESFCRLAECYDKVRNPKETATLLLDSLLFLLDESFHADLIPKYVSECCNHLFRIQKSQAILPVLQRLKHHGYYFLAHDGTASLETVDENFERELAFAIGNHYRNQGYYRLSQFYFAYGQCSFVEMRRNENIFLAELFCDENNMFMLNQYRLAIFQGWDQCTVVLEKLFTLGNYFWAVEDFERAKRIYKKIAVLLKEHGRDKGNFLARCAEGVGKLDLNIGYSEVFLAQPVSSRCLTRNAETEKNWSGYVKENVIKVLCEEAIQDLGPAPCQFSVETLGSLARDEACLYSDLEFAIIWRRPPGSIATDAEIRSYFRQFIFLLELKVISLGETNEISMNSDFSTESKDSRVFVKQRMRRGLQFDEGDNYPFSSLHQNELFLEIPLKPTLSADRVIKYNIVESCYTYGDESLSRDFRDQIRSLLDKDNLRQKMALDLLDQEFFTCSTPIEGSETFHVKAHLLKIPQWGIKAMALYYGIEERNTLLRIDALVQRHILTPEAGDLFKRLITNTLNLRMKLHREHQSEYDMLPVEQAHDLALNPALLKFFNNWHDNPNARHLGADLVQAAWQLELSREIVDPHKKTTVCIHGLAEEPVYLKEALCETWIDPKTGEFNASLRKLEDGNRVVVPAGVASFVKARPEGPGTQKAVSRFCNLFGGDGLPAKLCFFEHVETKVKYPVLFSAHRGETLLKKRRRGESLSTLEPEIDHYYYTIRIFEWLLLHLEDVKDDNVTFLRRLFGLVDDDHAFVESVVEVREFLIRIIKLKAKSILPCFEAVRNKPMDAEAKAWFLSLNLGQFLRQWLADSAEDEESLTFDRAELLAWAEHKTDPSIVQWLLEEGMTGDLYARFYRLQQALRSIEEDAPVTLLDAICRVEPHVGAIYKEVFDPINGWNTPEDRFANLRTDYKVILERDDVVKYQSQHVVKERVMRSISLPQEQKSKPTLHELITKGEFYTPRKALDELTRVESSFQERERLFEALSNGKCDISHFRNQPSFLKEYIINRLNWKNLPSFQESEDLPEEVRRKRRLAWQKKLLSCLYGVSLRELTLTDCDGLDNDVLLKITESCPELRVLEVRGCQNLTGNVIRDVASTCPNLVRLDVSGTNISSIKVRPFGSIPFPKLLRLKTEGCRALDVVRLDCPELLSMTSTGCVALEGVRLNSTKVQRLEFAGCERLVELGLGEGGLLDLKEVNVRLCHALSKKQLERVYRQSPNLNIFSLNIESPEDIVVLLRDDDVVLEEPDHIFKLMLVGASGIGKSCFLTRYLDGVFNEGVIATTGADIRTKKLKILGSTCALQVLDSAGRERFREVRESYYKEVDGVVVFFDLTNKKSFSQVSEFFEEIYDAAPENCSVVLVGLMAEFVELRQVGFDEGKQLADRFGVAYFEAAVRDNTNVREVFEKMAGMVYEREVLKIPVVSRSIVGVPKKVVQSVVPALPSPNKSKSKDYDHEFKICLIGDGGTGKSSFLLQHIDKRFKPDIEGTIGLEFGSSVLKIHGGTCKLQMWDMEGAESSRSINRSFYRGSQGFIVFFDVSRRESFNHLIDWIEDTLEQCPEGSIIIVGMKVDLANKRMVARDEGEKLARQFGTLYFEASAKTSENVDEVFEKLSEMIYEKEVLKKTALIKSAAAVPKKVAKAVMPVLHLSNNSKQKSRERLFKVYLSMPDEVGNILLAFTDNTQKFLLTSDSEFGDNELETTLKLQNDEEIGNKDFRSILRSYEKALLGVIVCFVVEDRDTFLCLSSKLEEIAKYGRSKYPMVVVGWISGLASEREVSHEEAAALAQKFGFAYRESLMNVDSEEASTIFETIADMIYEEKLLHRPIEQMRTEVSSLNPPNLNGITVRVAQTRYGLSLRLSSPKKDFRELNLITDDLIYYFESANHCLRINKQKKSEAEAMTVPCEFLFKMVSIGYKNIGKTALIKRYVNDIYSDKFQGTFGVDFSKKQINIMQNNITLQIWDFDWISNNMRDVYLRDTNGFILTFSLASRSSFFYILRLLEELLDAIGKVGYAHQCTPFSPIILVGLRSDLTESRQVKTEEAEAVARVLGIPYIETSARDNILVEEAFETLARVMLENALSTTVSVNNLVAGDSFNRESCESTLRSFGATIDGGFHVNCREAGGVAKVKVLRNVMKVLEKIADTDCPELFRIACRYRTSEYPEIAEDANRILEKYINSPAFVLRIFEDLGYEEYKVIGGAESRLGILENFDSQKIVLVCVENMVHASPVVRAGVRKALEKLRVLESPEIIQAYKEAEVALAKINGPTPAQIIPRTNSPIHSPRVSHVVTQASAPVSTLERSSLEK
ncbi:MAG TPA: GTP-binding protein [Gammaproteobacteria bacterium]|nr:GTP-binding protein [Gammaproteobacteria bacterium]